MTKSNELRYFDALRRITQYAKPESLRRSSERQYGLPYEEALEYAYENVIQEARNAIHGRRKPKEKLGSNLKQVWQAVESEEQSQ